MQGARQFVSIDWAQLLTGVELLGQLIWLPHCWAPPSDEEEGARWDSLKTSAQHRRLEKRARCVRVRFGGGGPRDR